MVPLNPLISNDLWIVRGDSYGLTGEQRLAIRRPTLAEWPSNWSGWTLSVAARFTGRYSAPHVGSFTASLAAASADPTDTSYNIQRLAAWMGDGIHNGKTVYDASFYANQPDLRPYGFSPLYLAYDGTLNRALGGPDPVLGYNFPDPGNGNLANVALAYRKVARAAAGQAAIPQHDLEFPLYPNVLQALCFDLEDLRFDALDAAAQQADRVAVVGRMCDLLDAVRAEQALIGVTQPKPIGIFLWPPPFLSGRISTNNPTAAMAQACLDYAPLVAKVDAFFPEVYCHWTDNALWQSSYAAAIASCRAQHATKPIYPFLTPHYAHSAGPSIKGLPIQESQWRTMLETIFNDDDTAGAVIWGGADERPAGNYPTPLTWNGAGLSAQAGSATSESVVPVLSSTLTSNLCPGRWMYCVQATKGSQRNTIAQGTLVVVNSDEIVNT